MSAQTSDMPIDCLRRDFQVPGNLSIGHAADGLGDDLSIEVGTLLPISLAESLGAETPFAGVTGKPLDTKRGLLSLEGASLLERPAVIGVVVVNAVRVWTKGWPPVFGICF